MTKEIICAIIPPLLERATVIYAGVAELADALDLGSSAKSMQVRPLSPAPEKATSNACRFFNDVCFKQMMLATPMMTASSNDAWLRHILWQISHHIATGDASFDILTILLYNNKKKVRYERKQAPVKQQKIYKCPKI